MSNQQHDNSCGRIVFNNKETMKRVREATIELLPSSSLLLPLQSSLPPSPPPRIPRNRWLRLNA
uniref:Uncharacterized protein n=1 Tax=Glossina pallidipes TaxID=7398 RepID=A0A1A9Z0P5_GLOPL